jgi:hypothetical protein
MKVWNKVQDEETKKEEGRRLLLACGACNQEGHQFEHLLLYEIKICFQARMYNGCCAGLHNKIFEGIEYSACIESNGTAI